MEDKYDAEPGERVDAPGIEMPVYLDDRAQAARWGISRRTLANQRSAGRSPLPYVKIGRTVRCLLSDVQAAERRMYGRGR